MKKIVFWTVILDTRDKAWQWSFMFEPTLSDLLTIVEGDASLTPLLELVREAQGTDAELHAAGGLTYPGAASGQIFIHQSEAFTK